MSTASTKRMISAYIETRAQPTGFLAGLFKSPQENFHQSEEVEIDIERSGEDVAIVVQDLSVEGRENESSVFTNKSFVPAIYKERFTLNSFELIKRSPGVDPFSDVPFLVRANREFMNGMRKIEDKIRRGIELQASQVLQTGKLTLANESGVELFGLDYKPKATHFPTAGTAWGAGGDTPAADLETLADIIYTDGKYEPYRLIFGKKALNRFLTNATVKDLLNKQVLNLGAVNPAESRGEGGKYHGTIAIGQYRFEIWSYAGWYKHPQTGVATRYITDDKVWVGGDGRLDLTFGAIPRIVPPDPRLAALDLGRVSSTERGIDLQTNVWVSPDGTNLHGSVATRALCIPTAIDTFGCIDTNAT